MLIHARRITLVLLAFLVVFVSAALAWWNSTETTVGLPCTVQIGEQSFTLSGEQAQHATTIALVAKRLDMPNRAVTVALATALQESKLRNIDYGDRDSLGIFQQRPSQGWGSESEIMQPAYSATKFFQVLADTKGWADMTVNDAAQAVQRSGYPTLYAQWEAQARLIARSTSGEEPATFTCRQPEEKSASLVATFDELAVKRELQRELGSNGIGVEVNAQRGWAITNWLVARADSFKLDSITFQDRRWESKTQTWKQVPSGEPIVRITINT